MEGDGPQDRISVMGVHGMGTVDRGQKLGLLASEQWAVVGRPLESHPCQPDCPACVADMCAFTQHILSTSWALIMQGITSLCPGGLTA